VGGGSKSFVLVFTLGLTATYRPEHLPGSQIYLPIEVLSDADTRQLEAAQKDLIAFGLDSSPVSLANHIYRSDLFSRTFSTPLYPVLKPTELYGVHQTWR
jgi:hypothetical protein